MPVVIVPVVIVIVIVIGRHVAASEQGHLHRGVGTLLADVVAPRALGSILGLLAVLGGQHPE
ncbi:MAG TPA: hypothetical protein PLS46_18805, partial [Microthrixaceae bacterium]|nr:hypothetical protein [Microthrixaceae bacterium]